MQARIFILSDGLLFFIEDLVSRPTGFGKLGKNDSIIISKVTKMPRVPSSLRLESKRIGFPPDDEARDPLQAKDVQPEPDEDRLSLVIGPGERSSLDRLLRIVAGVLTLAAVLGSAALLLSDAGPQLRAAVKFAVRLAPRAWAFLGHAPLSAMPLLLIGSAYVGLQALLRPVGIELLKRLMLGSAFLLWGVVQLMPPSVVATDLGDLVITLYVLDLGLIIRGELQGL